MIKKLASSLSLIVRVLKNALLRPFRVVSSKFKYMFSVGRVTAAIPGAVQKLPKLARRKPEKREDYFDWGRIYVSKFLVLAVTVIIAAVVLLYIFVLHPLFTSWWWVKDMYLDDSAVSDYNGRVRLYYDEELTELWFEGRLKDGNAVEYGEEFWENGRNKYAGNYEDGNYSGSGVLYLEDGTVLYRGMFSNGIYNGSGELYRDGCAWSGEFRNGKLEGSGTVTRGDVTILTGNFTDGAAEGACKENYDDGSLHYNGTYSGGVPHGEALEYYPNGNLKYSGQFTAGKYNGSGTLYDENGEKRYSGAFEMGVFSGSGTLYENGSKLYSGDFENGEFSGSGTLYGADGTVTTGNFSEGEISGSAVRTYPNGMKYEGCFVSGQPSGSGSLTNAAGKTVYSGKFLDGGIDQNEIIGLDAAAAEEYFPDAVKSVYDDCFRLTDSSGIMLECSFAQGSDPAAVRAVYCLPIGGVAEKIRSVNDITAPSAVSKTKTDGTLPEQAKLFGITPQDVDCYAVTYSETVVYLWVSKDGALLMKSAQSLSEKGADAPAADDSVEQTDRSDIEKLFEDIGLDIEDFESLGF